LGRVLDFDDLKELFLMSGGKKPEAPIEPGESRSIALRDDRAPSVTASNRPIPPVCIPIASRL
jgi:hypothetical protein